MKLIIALFVTVIASQANAETWCAEDHLSFDNSKCEIRIEFGDAGSVTYTYVGTVKKGHDSSAGTGYQFRIISGHDLILAWRYLDDDRIIVTESEANDLIIYHRLK